MSSFSSDLTDRNYDVKIGDYFSRGWEIFKQKAPLFILQYSGQFLGIGLEKSYPPHRVQV